MIVRNTFNPGTVLGYDFFDFLLYVKQVLRYYIFFVTALFFIKRSAKLAGK